MSDYVDANVLMRYITGTPADAANLARQIIEGAATPLYVSEVALAEVAWTLDRHREAYPREVLVDTLINLFRSTRLQVAGIEQSVLVAALMLCRPSRRVSFGDALILARVMMGGGTIYTFDREFPTGTGVTVRHLPLT